MKTGFWNNVDLVDPRFTLENEVIDTKSIQTKYAAYLKDPDIKFLEHFTANEFLHGFCCIFALCLHKKFGYEIYRIYDKEEAEFYFIEPNDIYSGIFPFIHDFAKTLPDRLIDIRGIIDDKTAFMVEFDDLFLADHVIVHLENTQKYESELKQYCCDYMGEKIYDILTEISNNWINDHLNYYAGA